MARTAFEETFGEGATVKTMLSLAIHGHPHPFISSYFHQLGDKVVLDDNPGAVYQLGEDGREQLRKVDASLLSFHEPSSGSENRAAAEETKV